MRQSIIPLFIPHDGCPYRCTFCNQWRITGQTKPVTAEEVASTINEYVQLAPSRSWEVAFYGGTFTALPRLRQKELLAPAVHALREGIISSIRLSTRPDCIDAETASFLFSQGVRTVELGVQSMDNEILSMAKRGHNATDVVNAMSFLREKNMRIGIQLMPGLGGENCRTLRKTLREVCRLQPDFVRIYPVLVVTDTELAIAYKEKNYRPLTLDEAVFIAAWWRMHFAKSNIPVIRMGLQATKELDSGASVLAGPYHPAFGEMVIASIYSHRIRKYLRYCKGKVTIFCNPKDTSKVYGISGSERIKMEAWYNEPIVWHRDSSLPVGTVRIEGSDCYIIRCEYEVYLKQSQR